MAKGKWMAATLLAAVAAATGMAAHAFTASLHVGVPPVYVAPAPQHVEHRWVPGHWAWNGYRQVWVEGYWAAVPRRHGLRGARWQRVPDRDRDGIPDTRDDDLDNDGRPNRYDRDIDGDGVYNWRDRDPANRYRY